MKDLPKQPEDQPRLARRMQKASEDEAKRREPTPPKRQANSGQGDGPKPPTASGRTSQGPGAGLDAATAEGSQGDTAAQPGEGAGADVAHADRLGSLRDAAVEPRSVRSKSTRPARVSFTVREETGYI